MFNLPLCPICSCPADLIYDTKNLNEKVYFCMDCCEHFHVEETLKDIHNRILSESTIIDEVFIKYMNSKKDAKKTKKNVPLDC